MPQSKKAISSKKRKAGLGFFLTLFLLAVPSGFTKAPGADVETRLTGLEKKLTEINQNLKAVLEKQDEILKKLDTVKIWARRG